MKRKVAVTRWYSCDKEVLSRICHLFVKRNVCSSSFPLIVPVREGRVLPKSEERIPGIRTRCSSFLDTYKERRKDGLGNKQVLYQKWSLPVTTMPESAHLKRKRHKRALSSPCSDLNSRALSYRAVAPLSCALFQKHWPCYRSTRGHNLP